MSRFVRADISELDSTKISIVGYLDNKNQLFLFHEEGFREACGNVSFKKVLGELDKLGLLYKNNNNRKKGRFKVSNVKERLNLYAVKYRFLEHDFG
ncbi:MAG: hypothetical protein KAT04_09210 [Methylococcales bacterium]|nr:hypothetical protein [Methylococcales bacterium]